MRYLGQVRDALHARTAPGGPEFDHIDLSGLESSNGSPFDPLRDLEGRGRIANLQRRRGTVDERCQGCQAEGKKLIS